MSIQDFKITSGFHEIDNFHSSPHQGVDYALPLYTDVEAIADGKIISVSTNDILGNHIRLQLNNGDIIIYGHLSSFEVKQNDVVHKGQIIGLSGGVPGMQGAGHSTGAHLHLTAIRDGITVNPEPYLLGNVQPDNSSELVFWVMIILMLVIFWRFRGILLYGLSIFGILILVYVFS